MSRAGSNFTLYSNLSTQAEAQAVCLKEGGHLASYVSEAEQYEVESFVSVPEPELGGCCIILLSTKPGCWCSSWTIILNYGCWWRPRVAAQASR
jgi:hypothetical protein